MPADDPSTLTIAITGPSGCGKSTLATSLARLLQSHGVATSVLRQDDYFCTPKAESYWTSDDKERPEAVDMVALKGELTLRQLTMSKKKGKGPAVLLLEGYLLLQDAQLVVLSDVVLLLDATLDASLARRLARSERTPHEDDGLRHYYRKFVWPAYERYALSSLPAIERSGYPLVQMVSADGGAEEVLMGALGALGSCLDPEMGAAFGAAAKEVAPAAIAASASSSSSGGGGGGGAAEETAAAAPAEAREAAAAAMAAGATSLAAAPKAAPISGSRQLPSAPSAPISTSSAPPSALTICTSG